jgi:hypothetical protein
MYLVLLAYSLLVLQLRQSRAKHWAVRRLLTMGEACRAVLTETLRTAFDWAVEQVVENPHKRPQITALLGLN